MGRYKNCIFPTLTPEFESLFLSDESNLIIVGVIGKSAFEDCNKLVVAFNILDVAPSLLSHEPKEGQISFYHKPGDNILFVHFETTFDSFCVEKMLHEWMSSGKFEQFMIFNSEVKTRFARSLLFATHICHIIVLVETENNFDQSSYLSLFKSLKVLREKHVAKFLPKMAKAAGLPSSLGKEARLCCPRFIFFFESFPNEEEGGATKEDISKFEFQVEDNIYKMLRNDFIIMNNTAQSLFSIPGNKRFVYFNTDKSLREDPLIKSIEYLEHTLNVGVFDEKAEMDELRPFKNFGKPISHYKNEDLSDVFVEKKREFMPLLQDYVKEALDVGFDDSLSKFKGKSHFIILSNRQWYQTFCYFHKVFIGNAENPSYEPCELEYKNFLETFPSVVNVELDFFASCCDPGLTKAISHYNSSNAPHYGYAYHKLLLDEAINVYRKNFVSQDKQQINEKIIRETCENIWRQGRQQCEYSSLRGNPCILPKHNTHDLPEHSSGVVFVSTCNCGRIQGRREDPYTIYQANFEFYQILFKNCGSCQKSLKIDVPVFTPSITDYRAAATVAESLANMNLNEPEETQYLSQPLTASQGSHNDLSLASVNAINRIDDDSSDASLNELETDEQQAFLPVETIYRQQPSTTEYLPGMVHNESPLGILPQFSSWSLLCVGPSSLYSHSTGLLEHFQSGFLSGANYLLPWDVRVRVKNPANFENKGNDRRGAYRKRGAIMLKIFVGCEYECPRGHRFIMSSPDTVLNGGSGIIKDGGSKIVNNDMPLYFSCPCRTFKNMVAQLMRVHVVTPKANVNVFIEPKVRTGERNLIFSMGLSTPAKLSQSAYWILRLPYIYQGEEGPISPPTEVSANNAGLHGVLLGGMFKVMEADDDL